MIKPDIRNVAIIAHVDHGKTTLVDALLKQAHAFSDRQKVPDRVMDSGEIEREKGITILAKNTAIHYSGEAAAKKGQKSITINLIDTPGHADFGGEVERGLSMVDGAILLVDASEGPLPQTRFVLRKALEAKLPIILVINKTDRPDSRIAQVVSETTDLLLSLAEDVMAEGVEVDIDKLCSLPVLYACAKAGRADTVRPKDGQMPANEDLEPLFAALVNEIPAPTYDPNSPLQALVTNIDSSDFLGRLGLIRVYNGVIEKGKTYGLVREKGMESFKVTELLRTYGLNRLPSPSAGPGDIVAVAGVQDIMIGESIVDLNDPRPLGVIHIDDPAISMTFGINDSPLAGTEGKDHKLTARMLKDRLDRELVGNISIKVLPTDRPDMWNVMGRGELALSVLAEQMRREGYELTLGRPQVVTRKAEDGSVLEPFEEATIDVPSEFVGAVSQLMALRKGVMVSMKDHGSGWVRLVFSVPSRGLIGIRAKLLTDTHGTAVSSSLLTGYKPWAGEIVTRQSGSMVSGTRGTATPYAMQHLQARGIFFVEPQSQVYEGQVVGIANKPNDLDVNITVAKHMTNMRSSTADVLETLTPPITLSLEEALDFAAEDECVEVTPEAIRVRKIILNREQWYKWRARQARETR